MIRRLVSAACCALSCITVTAQINFNPPPQTEQIETGFANLPGRPNIVYRIRLLPISSFPQLPPPVALQLDRLGCLIPQTYAAREPENVIQGAFEKRGSRDWAVLCSVNHVTTLYVFFQSDFDNPIPLRHQPDSQWLGVEWSLDYGAAWGIATRPAHVMARTDRVDHDGIEDAFIEQSSTVHIFHDGHWSTSDSSQ